MALNERDQMQAVFKSSRVDPVSGNEVPPGSLPEEVRDDVPAMLSEGEYVVPADVLRYYGVRFFEDLRNQAKMGLGEMHQNGRIGGEPIEAARGTLVQRPRQYGDLGGRSVEDVIAEARRLFGPAKSQQGMDFGGKTEEQIRAEVANIFGKPQQKIQQQGGGVDTSTQPSMDSAISQAVSMGNNAVTSVNNNNIPANVDQQMQEVFPENLDYKGKDITVSKLSDVADIVAQTAAALSQNKDQDFNPSLYGKDAVDVATDLGVDMMALSDAQNQPASNTSNQNMADEDTVMSQSVVSNKGYTPSNVDVASWSESKDAQPQVTPESLGVAVDMVEGVFSKNGFVPESNIQSIAELTGVPVSEVQGMVAAVSRSNQAEEVSYANPPSNSANLTGIESFMGNISGGTDVSQAEVDVVDMIGDLAAAGVFGMDTADTGTIGDIGALGFGGNADGGNAGPSGGDAPGPSGPSGGPSSGGDAGTGSDNNNDGFGDMGGIQGGWNKGGMVGYAEGGTVEKDATQVSKYQSPLFKQDPNDPTQVILGYDYNGGGAESKGYQLITYYGPNGEKINIPFFDGMPLGVIPPGYTQTAPTSKAGEEDTQRTEDDFGGLEDGKGTTGVDVTAMSDAELAEAISGIQNNDTLSGMMTNAISNTAFGKIAEALTGKSIAQKAIDDYAKELIGRESFLDSPEQARARDLEKDPQLGLSRGDAIAMGQGLGGEDDTFGVDFAAASQHAAENPTGMTTGKGLSPSDVIGNLPGAVVGDKGGKGGGTSGGTNGDNGDDGDSDSDAGMAGVR